MKTQYLYCRVPHHTEGARGAFEALLLFMGVPAEWQDLTDDRIYRIREDHIGPATGALGNYRVFSIPAGALAARLASGTWQPVRRAFGTVPKDAMEEAGPKSLWSVTCQNRGNGEFFEERNLPVTEAVRAYGRQVRERIHDHGPVTHWQPRMTEGKEWTVRLDGPAEPIP